MHCGMLNLRVPAANPPPASRFRLPPAWSMGDANRVPMASGGGGGGRRSCTRKRSGHHERRLPCIAHVRVRLSGNLPNHSPSRASCFTESDQVVSPSLPLSPSLPPSSLSPSRCPVIVRTPYVHAAPDPGLAVSSPSIDWSCLRLLLLAPPVAAVRLFASTCGRRGGRRTQAEASRVAPIAPRGGEVSARWRECEQPRCGSWRRSEWSSGPHGAG